MYSIANISHSLCSGIFLATLCLRAINASTPAFETTRLQATGGAGVASVLMSEATILNPAPLAFFQNGSFYFQKSSGQTGSTTQEAANAPLAVPITHRSEQLSVVAADAKSTLKGAFGYTRQTIAAIKKQHLMAAFAYPTGKKSSLGVNYRRVTEHHPDATRRYAQINLGVMHALNDQFTMGMVFVDPLRERPEETRGLLGGQYVYQDMVSFILDIGADYNRKLDRTFLWKGAIQFKLLDDFYLRMGVFNDRGREEEGTGVGVGWIQPRLVIDFALKNSDRTTRGPASQNFEETFAETRETSFGLSYRF